MKPAICSEKLHKYWEFHRKESVQHSREETDRKRSGRPRKTTKSDDRLIQVFSKRPRLKAVPDIRVEINQTLP